MEARTADGAEVGRISEVLEDEESGEVTHVVVEREEERFEVPITALSLDPEADFATFHADRSDEEPGDHVGDEELPAGYAPNESEVDDYEHEASLSPSRRTLTRRSAWKLRLPLSATRRAAGRMRSSPPIRATHAPTST